MDHPDSLGTVQERPDVESARKRGSKWKLLQANWAYQSKQFFETSTLHGVRYIAEKGRPYHERLLWFISTTAGLMAALVIVDSLWDKFQTNPTITGLDTDYHDWDVPFPGVALCLQNPGNESLIEQYVNEKWPNSNEQQKEYYTKFLNALTNASFSAMHNILPFLEDAKLPQTKLRELSLSLFQQCHAFTQCSYKQKLDEDPKDCCTMLFPIFTEHGLCFAFNLNFTLKDWPWPLSRPEYVESFIEETDAQWTFSFDSEDPVNNSVAVFVSSSIDLPGADVNPQHIWNKRVSKLVFVPKMTYTVDGARQLSAKQRGCVFWDEIKLKINPIYTFSSCARQCRMEKLHKKCGCLPFFYDLLPKQRYCELSELKCVIDFLDHVRPANIRCQCPLGCEHTVYDMEKPHEAGGGDGDGAGGETPGVEVGFLSWPLTRYKRDVLFGQVDLLVAIGTIAGLFLGFSLLSGVELVYLFTLRAWCMMYTDRAYLEELAEEYSRKEKEPLDLSLRPSFLKGEEGSAVSVTPVPANAPPLWKPEPLQGKNKVMDFYPYMH